MNQVFSTSNLPRWFFLIFAGVVCYLFWSVFQPYALALVTAGIFAIIFSPVEKWIRKYVRFPWLSSFLVLIGVCVVVLAPLSGAAILIAEQASDIVQSATGEVGWLSTFDPTSNPLFLALPEVIREQILALNFVEIGKGAAQWAFENLGNAFLKGTGAVISFGIFLMSFYFFMVERERIYQEVIALSPFKDKTDADIVRRMVGTVRSIVCGALIIAIVQATIGSIGMTIFGVPGALLWGSLLIIASQVPVIGTSSVMIPAVVYLLVSGHPWNALGLLIWGAVAVGMIDNLLSPIIVGSQTKMPTILVLIAILGGLQFFGPIGFILGPTVLAGMFVVIDLYKTGILDAGK
ncbi:MAG: AI-2E family transporter [Patescibacteria group bacterium]|jgi:predicted PurR-regulated permease PerM